jgi:hypothetical protein
VSDLTACGLRLESGDGDEDLQPIAALVIVKVFEPDGDCGVGYMVRATSGLSDVEAYGMAKLAAVRLLAGDSFGGGDL